MRPPCQDGVIVSNGMLYWGPWMCGCQLSLYGHICLGPAGDFDFRAPIDAARLEVAKDSGADVAAFPVKANDWACYRGSTGRAGITRVAVPRNVVRRWECRLTSGTMPTAPIAAGGMVFAGDRSGAVHAISADGRPKWKSCPSSGVRN